MALHEIVLDDHKPYKEWVRGRLVAKVTPTYEHGRLQRRIAAAMGSWAENGRFGRVASEWRFRVAPPGEIVRPLVPDVAYLSYAAFGPDAGDAVQTPLGAPTVAVEILSPDDRPDDLADKIATYLRAGSCAVIVVDPRGRTVTIHDAGGTRILGEDAVLSHDALPAFSLAVATLFAPD